MLHQKTFKGRYKIEHRNSKGQLLGTYILDNDIVNVGKDDILNKYFRNGTPPSAWYIGLLDNSGFTALSAADTIASHAGWNEYTNYSQSTRVAWGPDAASSQAVTNSTAAQFDITGSGTLKGIFVVSNSTKGGTSGTLWSTAAFPSTVPVSNGDQLKITYSLSC